MDLLQIYGSDYDAVTNGKWIELQPGIEDTGEILVARMWSPRFKEAFRVATDEMMQGKPIDYEPTDEENEWVMCKALSEATLLGWRNLTIGDDVLEYSTDKAFEVLQDKRLRDFADRVIAEAQKESNYRITNLEDTTGK